jgi:hypothetical protein
MPSFFRGITRRKRRIQHNIKYDRLQYLGSGSYGSVYAIPDTNMVLKEHRIFTMDEDALCQNWKKEFEIQQIIFNTVNSKLCSLNVGIVEPYIFSYAARDKTNTLIPQSNAQNAASCFFTMERVTGYSSSNMCFTRKLYSILKPTIKLKPATIPPYLYTGSLNSLDGHITLDMLQGTQLVEFPNEAYNYCIVENVALHIVKSMFMSFFTIVEAGFIPRDIEFVFNGGCHNIYISVLDFNEVKTLYERKKGRNDYDIDIDVAHVYIDLCGLRSSRDINPQALYDSPTPQWKFLCSPIISPYAFFECVEAAKGFRVCNIDRIIQEILRYAEKRCILPLFERTPHHIRSLWYPKQTEFSSIYTEFDSTLQLYYIYGLFETIERRKLKYPEICPTWKYKELLNILQSIVENVGTATTTIDADTNEWNSLLWSQSASKCSDELPKKHILRKRKYTIRSHILRTAAATL